MSSSAKRKQKSRQGQSDDDRKAENAKNAQRNREQRAAAKNAMVKDSQHPDPHKVPKVSLPDECSSLSLGANDSGFDKMASTRTKEVGLSSPSELSIKVSEYPSIKDYVERSSS